MAGVLLARYNIEPDTAARLVLEALEGVEACGGAGDALNRVRKVINLGVGGYRQLQKTVPFCQLVEMALVRKCYRRQRTLQEIIQFIRHLLAESPEWRLKPVRSVTAPECRAFIEKAYTSLVMRHKAKTLLHGLFAFALSHGWCNYNPLEQVDFPTRPEHRIHALNIREVRTLLSTSLTRRHLPCAPAVGFLLWAGIRPREMERLCWRNVNLKDGIITIPPEHAKTGGARQTTMQPVLRAWLSKVCPYRMPATRIVPPSWNKRWRELRHDAGFDDWDADILRHTFASYHLKRFRNLQELQVDMGHRSMDLLRTRYLNMDGITTAAAKAFWSLDLDSLIAAAIRARRPPLHGL